MQKIVYHSDAKQEVIYSARYYEFQSAGLGIKFLENHDSAISEIIESPLAWPILEGDYRRHQLEHFPFGVIYRVVDDVIRVLAIMHLHRKPGYWEKRDSQF
jgi:hypothetical protein